MAQRLDQLQSTVERTFDGRVLRLDRSFDEITLEIASVGLLDVMRTLRDAPELGFEQLIDLCIIQKAHLQMSEVENLISLLKVKTNHSIQRTGASRSAHASLVAQRPLAPSADAVRYAVTQSGVRC